MLHEKEANAKARDRLLAYMARKDGGSVQAIGRSLNRATTTACDRPAGAEGGPGRPCDIRRPGPARRLAAEQPAEPKGDPMAGPQAQGLGSGLWTGRMVARHVPSKYGVRYVPRTMQELLRDMGFGRARPRPRHPKAASGEEKNTPDLTSNLATYYHNRGYKILAGDEASHILGWSPRRGWYHEDAPSTAPVTLSRSRFHSIGAPGDGAPYCRFYDRPSTEACIDFLKGVYKEYGRFVIFLDNAPRHRPGALKRFLKKMDGRIRIYHFPPHAPEPSPAEVQWKPSGRRRETACMRARRRCRNPSMRCCWGKKFRS